MQSHIELVIVNNAMAFACDETQCQILHGDNLFKMVTQVYPKAQPLNTFWYHNKWDADNDVTPETAEDINALNELGGTFYLVTYPADPATLITIAISITISVAAAFLMPVPTMPNVGNATQPPSPNNSLSQRTNQARVGGRIADIYGQLRAILDLLAPPYRVYIDHEEVEFIYACLGRGWYNILKMFDDTTDVTKIYGTTVQVYNPGQHVVWDKPTYQFGRDLTNRQSNLSRLAVKRYTAINGQVLPPPDNFLTGDNNISFVAPNIIRITGDKYSFDGQFAAGDILKITTADDLSSSHGVTIDHDNNPETEVQPVKYNLNGRYEIVSVSNNEIVLKDPAAINSDWQKLIDNDDETTAASVVLSTESQNLWTDWVYTDDPKATGLLINLIAPNGIYTTHRDGDKFAPFDIGCEVETQQLNDADEPILDTLQRHQVSIFGRKAQLNADGTEYLWTTSDEARRTAAATHFIPVRGKSRMRSRRSSERQKVGNQQLVDEVKIKDLYSYRMIYDSDVASDPDCTLVCAMTQATEGALSVKERKLKGLVQRLVRDWQNNDTLIASSRIDDLIYDVATDPITGGLSIDDLNMSQIKAEVDAQIEYFGTDLCAQFCGTFDSTDITTEEMIQTIAQAGFFTAYRLNNKIHLYFERPEEYPVANFNSHSILPDSFEWAESFGPRNDYDGAEVTYVDPDNDDQRTTLKYPPDGSATNPDTKNKDLIGVRNKFQAHVHLMRRHWKNQFAYSTCSASVADEGAVVIPGNVVTFANQTRADTQQGAVESLSVNDAGQPILTLSNSADFGDRETATVFVQTTAATVDNIRCAPGSHDREIILSRAPAQPISTAWDAVVRATYQLVTHDDIDKDRYRVTSKGPGSTPMSHQLTAINDTNKYYQNDLDLKKGIFRL